MTLRGFTLVELLVSLAILGLVASFAIPSIVSSFHQVQQRTALKEAIKTVKVLFNGLCTGTLAGTS
jgi:prepilin-type N-terminal cleavage/methylation domain-containing protein